MRRASYPEPGVTARAVVYGDDDKVRYAAAVHDGIGERKSGENQFLRNAAMDKRPILDAAAKALTKELGQ